MGALRHKTRVLVTNQLQLLSPSGGFGCDRILLLNHGVMTCVGTFDELMVSDDAFKLLIETHSQQEDVTSHDSLKSEVKPHSDCDSQSDEVKGKLTAEETREEGDVGYANYKRYAQNAGYVLCIIALMTYIACEVTRGLAEFSVAAWSNQNRSESEENNRIMEYSSFVAASPSPFAPSAFLSPSLG